jgi:hypothetical protein
MPEPAPTDAGARPGGASLDAAAYANKLSKETAQNSRSK